jgi:predicted small lipoprotein YifL
VPRSVVLALPALLTLSVALTGCGRSSPVDTPIATAPAAGTPTPAASDTSEGPTAQQVVDDFAAVGLAVPKPRDNTAGNCPSLGCAQLITTDALSVVQFDDPTAQRRYAASFGDNAHTEGVIVLQYAAAHTPTGKRTAYEKRLRTFLDQMK